MSKFVNDAREDAESPFREAGVENPERGSPKDNKKERNKLKRHLLIPFLCQSKSKSPIGGFQVTSSPPCWWTKKKLSLASFVCPPEVVNFSFVIGVSRSWLKTSYT